MYVTKIIERDLLMMVFCVLRQIFDWCTRVHTTNSTALEKGHIVLCLSSY